MKVLQCSENYNTVKDTGTWWSTSGPEYPGSSLTLVSHLSIREQLMWAFPSSSVRLWNSIDNDVQLMRFGLVLAVNDRVEAGKEEKPMVNGEHHWPEHRNLTKRPFKSMEWYHIHASLISEKEERTRTWKQKLALIKRFSREFSHVLQKNYVDTENGNFLTEL